MKKIFTIFPKTTLTFFVLFMIQTSLSGFSVMLVDFNAELLDSKVALQWKTTSETNNSRFEIERSINGSAFQVIATINGHGTCHDTKKYEYTDNDVLLNGCKINYRLKQIDIDGNSIYSKTIMLNTDISVSHLQFFPNPFSEELRLAANMATAGQADIYITDQWGLRLQAMNLQLVKGINNVRVPVSPSMPAGAYFVEVWKRGDRVTTSKIIKQ